MRNLKALGLTLVAVFAFSAMAASTASAQTQGELTTENGQEVTLNVTETSTPGLTYSNALTSFGSTVHCPGTTYKGHKVGSPTALVPNKSTEITITPNYKQPCHVTGGRQATIITHGCDFVFRLGVSVSAGTWPVTAKVVCPNAAEGITVTTFENTPPAAEGGDLCTVEITGGVLNQNLTGPHVTNTPAAGEIKDDLDVHGTFKNIHAERTGLCAIAGGNTITNGEFHLDATIQGVNKAGAPTGITVS